MNGHEPIPRLRIGMIGSGFIANFHLQALVNVRHVTVGGIFSPNATHREALAAKANALELGPCRAFPSLEAMLLSGEVDAVWIGVPNFARLETMREIHRLVTSRWAKLVGVACEKPLGRTLAEAREMLRLAEDTSSCTAIWRTRSSQAPCSAERTSSGAGRCRPAAARFWRAPPKSTAARTCRGSGKAAARAAAFFPT